MLRIGLFVRGTWPARAAIIERGATMRRLSLILLAGAAVALTAGQIASAADLGVKRAPPPVAPAYVPAPVFRWTGFYIGGNLGAAWTSGTVTDNFGNSFSKSNRPHSPVVARSGPI